MAEADPALPEPELPASGMAPLPALERPRLLRAPVALPAAVAPVPPPSPPQCAAASRRTAPARADAGVSGRPPRAPPAPHLPHPRSAPTDGRRARTRAHGTGAPAARRR